MESPAVRNGDGLHVVILADTLRALFAEARADTLDIGQDERLTRAATDEGIENDGLKEGQTEHIGREGHALPAVCGDEVDGGEIHRKSLPDLERLAQVAKEQLAFFRVRLREVLEPPLNGGQFFNVRDIQQLPLRFSFLDG